MSGVMNLPSPSAAGNAPLKIVPSANPKPVPMKLTAIASPSTSDASCGPLHPIVASKASSRRRSSTAASIVFATASVPMINASTTISSTAFEISTVFAPARIASFASAIAVSPGNALPIAFSAAFGVIVGSSRTATVVVSSEVRPASFWASASVVIAP